MERAQEFINGLPEHEADYASEIFEFRYGTSVECPDYRDYEITEERSREICSELHSFMS